MTLLEPSNPARIALRLQERFEAMSGPVTPLDFARAVELSRVFSGVRVLGDLLESEWLLRVTDAATNRLSALSFPDLPSYEIVVALERAVDQVSAAVATVAAGGDLSAHEAGLRVATAMLTAADEPQDSLSDLDLFVGSATRDLEITRLALDRLALDPTDHAAVAEAFRAVHAVRGDAGVMGAAALEEVCRRLESVLDALRSGDAVATPGVVSASYNLVDYALDAVLRPGEEVDAERLDQLAGVVDEGRSLARATRLGELLVGSQLVDENDVELALAIKSGPVGRTLVNLKVIDDDDLDRVLELQRELRREGAARSRVDETWVRRVAVAEETLQALTQAVQLLQENVVDLPTIPLMQDVVRLTQQLQMQTMGSLFRKAARAARALAEELGKELWVSVSGADVEVHREILDALNGPLLQLVRNALDHGIESPAVRQVAGKPARATLTLCAHNEEAGLTVQVVDDGAGIDISRVLQRAIDMGLVTEAAGAQLSDEEIQTLIFEPGLSATERVGRISGRGVGMDVVENAVVQLGGRITVESQRGLGTRFRLWVPHRR